MKYNNTLFASFIQLGAGLSVGLSGLAAGFAIGVVGDAGVRGTAQQPRLFVGMILILIFAEVLVCPVFFIYRFKKSLILILLFYNLLKLIIIVHVRSCNLRRVYMVLSVIVFYYYYYHYYSSF